MGNSELNWILALVTGTFWIGSTVFYFKDDIKRGWTRWKAERAERRATGKR
jgi:hypothetical protein